jgi:multidrug efflux pump subunit AcrA (membrane-fusion protein)
MKTIITLLALITSAYAATTAAPAPASKTAEHLYETYVVTTGSVRNGLKVTGKIVPLENSIYFESARITGRVSSVMVKEGDTISSGTKLLLINSAECLSLFQEKKTAKERNLKDILSMVEIREQQLSLVVNEGTCYIVSSKSGVVTKKMVEAGSNFNSGDNLFTIIDRHSLTVELDVPERDANKVKLGQHVVITRPSANNDSYVSSIEAIIPSLASVSRTVKIRLKKIGFKQNPTIEEFVFGEIETGEKGILFKVPSASVVFSGDRDFVLKVIEKEFKAVEVDIVNQMSDFSFIRVKKPELLKAGDTVIAKGAVFLFQSKFVEE